MKLLDCTLRDGANVVGKGFNAAQTKLMLEGLIGNGVRIIEYGNCLGIGAYECLSSIAPLDDLEYLELGKKYAGKCELGMFAGHKNMTESRARLAAEYGLAFLRVGADAGDGQKAREAIEIVKKSGLKCRYSIMKAYVLNASELSREAKALEEYGADELTIMDSAGTMTPDEVSEYVKEIKTSVSVPVGFHGHNNLSLATANAIAAYHAGADMLDCGLMGMARSSGNLATEIAVAVFGKMGLLKEIDFYGLLHFIEGELMPAIPDYVPAVTPIDLVYGLSGCHSNFGKLFDAVAEEMKVDKLKLVTAVSEVNKKNPDVALLRTIAETLKG